MTIQSQLVQQSLRDQCYSPPRRRWSSQTSWQAQTGSAIMIASCVLLIMTLLSFWPHGDSVQSLLGSEGKHAEFDHSSEAEYLSWIPSFFWGRNSLLWQLTQPLRAPFKRIRKFQPVIYSYSSVYTCWSLKLGLPHWRWRRSEGLITPILISTSQGFWLDHKLQYFH